MIVGADRFEPPSARGLNGSRPSPANGGTKAENGRDGAPRSGVARRHRVKTRRSTRGPVAQWTTLKISISGETRPTTSARSCEATNGFARKCHPSLSTSIPSGNPDISSTLS